MGFAYDELAKAALNMELVPGPGALAVGVEVIAGTTSSRVFCLDAHDVLVACGEGPKGQGAYEHEIGCSLSGFGPELEINELVRERAGVIQGVHQTCLGVKGRSGFKVQRGRFNGQVKMP